VQQNDTLAVGVQAWPPQSIPTTYRGYRCRSRLEARWCILLDELNVEYWYEPEGFRLSNGACYLPDFYLPQIQTYAEVKPDLPNVEELAKAESLCLETRKKLVWLVGPPAFKTYPAIYPDCGYVTWSDVLLDIDYHGRKHYAAGRLFADCNEAWKSEEEFTNEYRAAVYAARAARFEEAL